MRGWHFAKAFEGAMARIPPPEVPLPIRSALNPDRLISPWERDVVIETPTRIATDRTLFEGYRREQ